jgi:hypothetical protein
VIANTTIYSPYFTYSQAFKYRWQSNSYETSLTLNTGVVTVTPGATTSFEIAGQTVSVTIPAENAGIRGLIIGDPCTSSMWTGCAYLTTFDTYNRLTALVNSAMGHSDTHFWDLLGDNFYDQDGSPSTQYFQGLSLAAKSKVMHSVPGNHDYWVMGNPDAWTQSDQLSNGFMQFYAQDVYAAKSSSSASPFDFSVNPDTNPSAWNIPPASDFFYYHKLGNVGFLGFSGAHSWGDQKSMFKEACSYFTSAKVSYVLLEGHWIVPNYDGCKLPTPSAYASMATLPQCLPLLTKIKYFNGHEHW